MSWSLKTIFQRQRQSQRQRRGADFQQCFQADSAAISAVEYDPELCSMRIEFKNGGNYEYGCVSAELFAAFKLAESKGRFLHGQILNRYPYRRLVADPESSKKTLARSGPSR